MQVGRAIPQPHQAPRVPGKSKQENGFWKDRADEVRELLLLMNQEKLEDAGKLLKSIGSGLKGAWQQIKEVPAKLFHLPILSNKVSPDQQKKLVEIGETLGVTVGFIAAGGHALGGALKIASGHQQHDKSRKLDGIVDIATAATLTATVAGFGGARAVLAPLAAAFNVYRGGFNAGQGYKTRNGREQLQGTLDAVRSAGSVGRLLKHQAAFFHVAGVALAPIAGALQAGRGMHDISIGLKNADNKKELDGLVDIATAVGTALAFASGVAVIPGIALAVAANIAKLTYQFSPKARKKMDGWIDKAEPAMQKAVNGNEKLTAPIRRAWKAVMSHVIKKTDHEGPKHYSKSELAEMTHLLLADGDYSRTEERRLKTTLEQSGQVSELPRRGDPAPARDLEALKKELPSGEDRKDFLAFLYAVANYDHQTRPQEDDYIRALAGALGIAHEDIPKALVPAESVPTA